MFQCVCSVFSEIKCALNCMPILPYIRDGQIQCDRGGEKNYPQFDFMVGCILKRCEVNSRSLSSWPLITPAPVIAM